MTTSKMSIGACQLKSTWRRIVLNVCVEITNATIGLCIAAGENPYLHVAVSKYLLAS